MRYYKMIIDGYLVAVGNGSGGTEITADEYAELLNIIRNKPSAESGFDYRLREDLEWELYEIPTTEEEAQGYTAEQLAELSNDELKAILAEMGISATMNKANMIKLILSMQRGDIN